MSANYIIIKHQVDFRIWNVVISSLKITTSTSYIDSTSIPIIVSRRESE
jgi:hypothetical protein